MSNCDHYLGEIDRGYGGVSHVYKSDSLADHIELAIEGGVSNYCKICGDKIRMKNITVQNWRKWDVEIDPYTLMMEKLASGVARFNEATKGTITLETIPKNMVGEFVKNEFNLRGCK